MLTSKIRINNKFYNLNAPFPIIVAFFVLLLLSEIFLSIYYFNKSDSISLEMKKKEIIRIVDVAYAACVPIIDQRIKSEIDANTAEKRLTSIISKMSYHDERGLNYIFLLKKDGTLLTNLIEKNPLGSNIFTSIDRNGKNFISEIIKTAYSSKEGGFVTYSSDYPDRRGFSEKISYVRSIPILDFIIGTGVYIDRLADDKKAIFFPRVIGSISIITLIIIVAALSLLNIKNNLSKLKISENIFKSVFNDIDHLVGLLDSKLCILALNRTALQFMGLEGENLEGKPFVNLPVWTNMKGSRDVLEQAIAQMNNGKIGRYQVLNRKRDGEIKVIDFSIYPFVYGENQSPLYIAEGKNITELKEKENEIYKLAYFDQITDLPKETLFAQMVSGFLKSGDQTGAMIAIIRLTNLSFINSMQGFEMGNQMLRSFAEMLIRISSVGCIAAKFSGGNFALYIPPDIVNTKKEEIFSSFNELCLNKTEPLKFGEHEMHVNVLIGVAEFPEHGANYQELLLSAMIAKDESNNYLNQGFQIFNKDIAEKIHRRSRIEEALMLPGVENSMYVHFQPQIDLKTGMIDSFEALARWHDEKIGQVSPTEFIPIAERTGIINKIFSFVLSRAGYIANIVNSYGIHISVNVSVIQLIDDSFPETLVSITNHFGIPSSSIAIEITESILMESFDSTLSMLKKLKSMGYLIYLDDFGTGFSSLSYLRNLPIDILKLDKTFVQGIDSDEKNIAFVKLIIDIAHNLGMKVVAEGVETESQASLLKKIDCDFSQGWYTGKPMTEEEAIKIVMRPALQLKS
jgi:PAS domain S-box-containing protein